MDLYAALDVELETTTVCVVDREGAIVMETISASDPDILADRLVSYAVDNPSRFTSSKSVGAVFGPTPRRYQSGETDRVGSISRAGDSSVRVALFEAAHVMMVRSAKWSVLRPGR
jgi:transposase